MLDEKQIKCAELLSQGIGPTEIAKEIGISRRTIYYWKENPEFADELHNLAQEFLNTAAGRLQYAAPIAANKLVELMTNGKYEKTRLAAAMDILDRGLGKATTKVEVSDSRPKETVTTDELERELNEFVNE